MKSGKMILKLKAEGNKNIQVPEAIVRCKESEHKYKSQGEVRQQLRSHRGVVPKEKKKIEANM